MARMAIERHAAGDALRLRKVCERYDELKQLLFLIDALQDKAAAGGIHVLGGG